MGNVIKIHRDTLVGNLSGLDRLVFKGHLTRLFPPDAFRLLLARQGVLRKDFKGYVSRGSTDLKTPAPQLGERAGRSFMCSRRAPTTKGPRRRSWPGKLLRKWPRILNSLACKVNPMLEAIRPSGFGAYPWVADQGQHTTDVMFRISTPPLQAQAPSSARGAPGSPALSPSSVPCPRPQGQEQSTPSPNPGGLRLMTDAVQYRKTLFPQSLMAAA